MFLILGLLSCSSFASAKINLGSAATFGVLSSASVTNTGATVINGDLGTVGTSITGFPPGVFTGTEITGTPATKPLNDAQTAYNVLTGLGGATPLIGDLGGMTLAPGTYSYSSSAAVTGTLTLAGTGSSSDAWYFQIGSSLVMATGSSVVLTEGAQACDVFWQVGTSATLGTGSLCHGPILAGASVTLNTDAVSNGGVFGLTGSVTLDANTVNLIEILFQHQYHVTEPHN
ncbi:uncharacterized protein K444DRAFT_647409 [Hyaloscypha bicolor E]|uniref:Antifreeze protein n=1 Tax=Hyaloscypha bicolor E TaxID=1095630 RepID=A0A2J6SJY1_9HELO|nr:uncharacterized protein K444DRAFT_647409 [Hyaloscypha bicolor E]PMD51081.1 hypothetical protein K444DRAFT_647409 [Hyaloscypha bicolor E]